MCRECGPNYRRCPSSYGEARAARERAKYGAGRAATASVPKHPHVGAVHADTHDTATSQATPTVEHIRSEINRLSAAMNAPHALDSNRASVVSEFGSTEAAVRHVGDLIAQRAEHHAGVRAADVQNSQGSTELTMKESLARIDEQFGLGEMDRRMTALKRQCKIGNLAERTLAQIEHNKLVGEWNGIVRSPEYKSAQRAAKDAVNGTSGETGELLTRLRDGYAAAVAEVRPLGGELKLGGPTTKGARAAFQEAADYYPHDWVQHSNAADTLAASVTTTRAHYADAGQRTKRVKMPAWGFRRHLPDGEDPNDPSHELSDSMYRYVKQEEDGGTDPGMTEWRSLRQETVWRRTGEEPQPKGTGWSEFTDKQGSKYWRRDKYKTRDHIEYGTAEIRANKGSNLAGRSDTYATATHEMAHRFEVTVPDVRRIENEFLRRRTTMSDGNRERRVNVGGASRDVEPGWADSFVEAYVGRDYSVAREDIAGQPSTEVLSVGIEALYGGHFGGLVGAGRYKADLEHRSLVLGMLAIGGRR